MAERLPITTPTDFTSSSARRPARDGKEVGRRGVAQARAALAEARQRARERDAQRVAQREAELLAGRNQRKQPAA
ncbi:MAG: hypothetical protein ACKO04_16450 [Actinomycetes bacterium]